MNTTALVIASDAVDVNWEPSLADGGEPITNYVVQYASEVGTPTLVESICGSLPNTASITFRWTAPRDNGGCAMQKYQVLQDGTAVLEVEATTTSATFNGLTCASSPKFTVKGKNCLDDFYGESA